MELHELPNISKHRVDTAGDSLSNKVTFFKTFH